MPPSQLKRLKASLREQGVIGPQKSKKQKQSEQRTKSSDKRVQKAAALSNIREQFNPFEFKQSARGPKFEVTGKNTGNGATQGALGRPSAKRSAGEDNRRKTLLLELQRRNKVGGIMDRRFGENDPTVAPEEKMLERFTQERQHQHKRSSAFDLEDDGESMELTHFGRSLDLDGPMLDDFDEEGLGASDDDNEILKKRRRLTEGAEDESAGEEEDGDAPARKKSKQEVMKEVIAKSKLHRYERQAQKEDDDDIRLEVDKELADIHMLLRGAVSKPIPAATADDDKAKFDKEYDVRLKQLARDRKSKPTERTKTEEEKLAEESRRLQELEKKRLQRMQGEPLSDDEQDSEPLVEGDDDAYEDFGLGRGIQQAGDHEELGVEDEDDFIIDDDLVASGSEIADSVAGDSDIDSEANAAEDEDFLDGLLTAEEAENPEFLTGANAAGMGVELPTKNGVNGDLAFTFPCPENLSEMVDISKTVAVLDLVTVVQRIRMLHHPKLRPENKEKMAVFTVVLVDFVSHLANQPDTPFSILEGLVRHIHSLAKSYPTDTANAFRHHLRDIHASRPLALTAGDLILLTAIGNIFPTSDHFHQVVTPAILTMSRYMGQKVPHVLSDYVTGSYLCTLCLKYQQLSKRYVPELMDSVLNTLNALAPTKPPTMPGTFPRHDSQPSMRIGEKCKDTVKVSFSLVRGAEDAQPTISSKVALLDACVKLLESAATMWSDKVAFIEIFDPALKMLQHLQTPPCTSKLPKSSLELLNNVGAKLEHLTKLARNTRRPLELHHHRPLAIKGSIPKFEESYNPDKHYDPDRERAEAAKLRAEYKKERKGAMRELRKDANFIARESLRQKKDRDAAYEKKFKRLIAEINQEEGKEGYAYEREKQWRKKGKK